MAAAVAVGGGGANFLPCSSAELLLLLGATNWGATLSSVNGGGAEGSLLDSGLWAGTGTGPGQRSGGSLAGVDRLHVRVVVSLEGLS